MATVKRYRPTMDSVRSHKVPEWYHAAKLGIFIHWGLYSVPAYAPPSCELGEIEPNEEWFTNNPYAEWYWNSIRVGRGPSYDHHVETYGKNFAYNDFAHDFKAEAFDAEAWLSLFKAAGAKYLVPVTKHHDGYCLWDTAYTDFKSTKLGAKRDIIAELHSACLNKGLHFGTYYSGILDWQYAKSPIFNAVDLLEPPNVTAAYADYAFNQVMELIDKYKPEVMWNDINWPYKGEQDLPSLFAYYYNNVPTGVVNDRWNGVWDDFTTKEYKQGEISTEHKWEMCRGLGLSFGYNSIESEEHIISKSELISLLVKTVSHNGNLLINVGPKADGTIPAIQEQRLRELGAWLDTHGEAIYDTDIWLRQKELLAAGVVAYYTQNKLKDKLYIMLDTINADRNKTELEVRLPGLARCEASIEAISKMKIEVKAVEGDLVLNLSELEADYTVLALKAKLM